MLGCLGGEKLQHCRCQLGSGPIGRPGGHPPIWDGACSCRLQLSLQEQRFRVRGHQVSVLAGLGFSSCSSGACCSSWLC